jgi:hypothetical protein
MDASRLNVRARPDTIRHDGGAHGIAGRLAGRNGRPFTIGDGAGIDECDAWA